MPQKKVTGKANMAKPFRPATKSNNRTGSSIGSGINSDAFVAGFKYGQGIITKAEAKALVAKSKFKGLSAKEKITYAFSARNEKPMVRAKVSARKGISAAKQENAMIQRGKKK